MNYFPRDGVLIWYTYYRNYDILNKVLDFNIDIFSYMKKIKII